jgi:hypothetical protein
MGNLYVIPTENFNPLGRQLWIRKNGGYFKPTKANPIAENLNGKVNIYITSDEEIKENELKKGDWYYSQIHNKIFHYYELERKIILTTDPYLIKDGVQAIDDEFLEWFVNNPSCEFVKTKLVYDYEEHPELVGSPKEEWSYYKIIIPKEEPKPETFIKSDNIEGQWLSPVRTERAWQEEQLVNIFGHYPNASPRWQYMNGLIQNSLDAKQMYSEEEVKKAITNFYMNDMILTDENLTKVINNLKTQD